MSASLRTEKKMPYCLGCSHQLATNYIAKTLEKMEMNPLDVIVVSDIGCCGLIDPLLTCHTIHGLHGRATALAMGITLGLNNPDKKVIAIQGDGGATIGLQHLLEAARLNMDLTLIIQNNMVYGMTGGQISGLSSGKFKILKMPEESNTPPFDICRLAHQAGAAYSTRIIAKGDFTDRLAEAFTTRGFSLVEVCGLCPSYARRKASELVEEPFNEETLTHRRDCYQLHIKSAPSLFEDIPHFHDDFPAHLAKRVNVIIAGSAGGGVQLAADMLSFAAVASGLKTTKKGEYPITVGTGFSVAEVILSRDDIHYTGIDTPDVAIVVTGDGLEKIRGRIKDSTYLVLDEKLDFPLNREGIKADFHKMSGKKGAVLSAITAWLGQSKVISIPALLQVVKNHKHAEAMTDAINQAIP